MQYDHETFTKALHSQRANFPHLKYEEASELIHLVLKLRKGQPKEIKLETHIDAAINERGLVKELQRGYRSFAFSYFGIMGRIIQQGRKAHRAKTFKPWPAATPPKEP
ncbi:MAG TPA: hypothetical protein VGE31_02030 [Candidatus Paceibacterota bacterium]